ncbi:hypothetical protein E2C01_056800 [Portunus trituberculatus]|uniref:Uncharacterized protein n=1 Tax=Portunus trituberculatus TaxID=210409 RepID=A0A5B7GRB8_PORTR|nr:hypothetical protein [Portunus trituberculatus]
MKKIKTGREKSETRAAHPSAGLGWPRPFAAFGQRQALLLATRSSAAHGGLCFVSAAGTPSAYSYRVPAPTGRPSLRGNLHSRLF